MEESVWLTFWVVGIQGRQAWWGEAGKERDGGAGLGKAGSKAMEPLASAKGPLMDSSPILRAQGFNPKLVISAHSTLRVRVSPTEPHP